LDIDNHKHGIFSAEQFFRAFHRQTSKATTVLRVSDNWAGNSTVSRFSCCW
jgi:hypothetical protein